ncbi:MAG TPA: NADH-quinone oxidoreductase subunit L [Verrucomicrobiae bacterium]|nr:NADH-quinone oxidoreductase subunit L [Verrucomicrobiae bacterium]
MDHSEYLQQLAWQQWLIPFFPLVAAAIQSLLKRPARKPSAALTIVAMGLSCILALRAFFATLGSGEHHEVERAIFNFTWFKFGTTSLELGFILDPLTAGMAAMVAFVGFWIFVNATGYMADDENFTRFFCFLSLFAASMLGLVISNNLLLLFMCWELVGLCSYLLIGFWYFKPSAAAAMKKAFITTRIGDVGFLLGIVMLYWKTGTLNLYTHDALHPGALEQASALVLRNGWWGLSAASTIAFLVFIGAMGKSAQFPLHVWLPDAMEGPTPVSALIHAATMVAAGVFMVGRMYPLFIAEPGSWVPDFVMWIGCITAVFSATIAVAQFDIKRVLAYSTCSQLGYMVMALGAGSLVAGQFHLLTHAFFKALLFLGSGCVIIGTHHEQDMRKMGGLRKYMPITFVCYVIGMLALSGFPLTAGFFSKDEILLATFHRNKWAWGLGTFAAFLTAFYMTRQIFMVFFGQWRGGDDDHGHGHEHHEPHEVPWNMWLPIAVLSVFALFMGWLGTPWFGGNLFHHYLAPEEVASEHSDMVLWLSVGVGLLGIILGWLIYGRKTMVHATDEDPLATALGGLFTFLNRKWYIDELYEATVFRFTATCAMFFRLVVDKLVVDGCLHLIAKVARGISQIFRWVGDEFFINGGFDAGCEGVELGGEELSKLQDGRVQNYFRVLSLGAAVLLLIYFFT